MAFTKSQHPDADVRAIEDALSRIGEPITEAQANAGGARRLRVQGGHVRVGGNAAAAFRRHGTRRGGRNDGDAAAPR